jgi:hypothetical protein
MTFDFSGNEAGWASLGFMLIISLVLVKTLRENGIFCLTPCGPHACIIDTNSGNAATIQALALVRREMKMREKGESKNEFIAPIDLESNHSDNLSDYSDASAPERLPELVRDHANIVTDRLNRHFEEKNIKSCAVS